MNTPAMHANEVIAAYFASRGEAAPEDRARSLIKRVRIDRRTNHWQREEIVSEARAILTASAFDIDDLAENFLGVDLSISRLDYLDERADAQVFGAAYPDDRWVVICERAESYLPLYRATVAHELGHVLLHQSLGTVEALNYAPWSRQRPAEESQADEFMHTTLDTIGSP